MTTPKQAALSGNFAPLADLVRAHGGTYADAFRLACDAYEREGREAPTLADFDASLAEDS